VLSERGRGILLVVRRGLVAGLCLGLMSCGGQPEQERLGRASVSVNGTVDSSDQYPMVVGVVVNKSTAIARCSGVLIAANLVLTARHCLSPTSGGLVQCGSSPLGTPYPAANVRVTRLFQMSDLPEDYLTAARIEVVPGGNDTCGYDLAAVVLEGEGFGAQAKTAIPRIDVSVVDGEEHVAVGYGSDGSGGIGVRRFKPGLYAYCVGTACPLPVPQTEWVGASDSFCQADSGAPALDVDGKAIGVVSRGQDPCATPILANLAEWKSWIMELGVSAAADGGYAAPFWALTGVSDPPPESDAGSGSSNQGSPCPCSTGFVCLSPDGTVEHGSCARTCTLDSECGTGLSCRSDGVCATENGPEAADDEDSGCSLAPADTRAQWLEWPLWIVVLGGFAFARRRRC
jgi:MYXO-CTERM domain-containing protein